MKQWYDVEITRIIVNNKDETVKRNVQHHVVWGLESTAVGLAYRRSPDPFADEDRRRVSFVEVTPLGESYDLNGRNMSVRSEKKETKFGLNSEELKSLTGGAEA